MHLMSRYEFKLLLKQDTQPPQRYMEAQDLLTN